MPNFSPRSILCTTSIRAPLAVASIIAITANEARAHHVTVGGPTSAAGPINAPSADTLRKGEVTVAMRAQTENYDEFSNDALEGFAASGLEGVHNTDAAYVASLALEFGVTDDLSIGVVAPFVLRYGVREGELEDGVPEAHILGDARGFGDLVVLDLMLPGEDGFSICRRLSAGEGPPIIILSARGEDVDRIVGLEIGADD